MASWGSTAAPPLVSRSPLVACTTRCVQLHNALCCLHADGCLTKSAIKTAGVIRSSVLTATQCATYDEVKRWVISNMGWQDGIRVQLVTGLTTGESPGDACGLHWSLRVTLVTACVFAQSASARLLQALPLGKSSGLTPPPVPLQCTHAPRPGQHLDC